MSIETKKQEEPVMIEDSFITKNRYEDFDKPPQEIEIDNLLEFLGDDTNIFNIYFEKRISTIVKIALLQSGRISG